MTQCNDSGTAQRAAAKLRDRIRVGGWSDPVTVDDEYGVTWTVDSVDEGGRAYLSRTDVVEDQWSATEVMDYLDLDWDASSDALPGTEA